MPSAQKIGLYVGDKTMLEEEAMDGEVVTNRPLPDIRDRGGVLRPGLRLLVTDSVFSERLLSSVVGIEYGLRNGTTRVLTRINRTARLRCNSARWSVAVLQ